MAQGKKAGPGRPKGSKNKFTSTMKEAFLVAYEDIGGDDSLADWAKDNKTEFYKICARMIPNAIEGDFRHTSKTERELTDDELKRIAASGSTRAAAKKGGEDKLH